MGLNYFTLYAAPLKIGQTLPFCICINISEHRNMPLEDALQLLSRNFQEVQRGGPSGREAVYALLGQLADGRSLTVLQYDKVIEYLQVCITVQLTSHGRP